MIFLKNRPIHFHNNSTGVIRLVHAVSGDACNCTCTDRHIHKQDYICTSSHAQIIVFSLLFCYYYMFPVRRTFPNVMWTLYGKTFCLNCLAECLKQPSKIDLCFKSKYFVISVADQLNQNSFMNCWWNLKTVHILITSYNRLFCFRENILVWCSQPSILPKTNIK